MLSLTFINLISLLKFIILFLIITIIIATLTLIERKVLSLVQRRVGPNYVGYKGRLQFIADALKLLLKHIAVINKTNRSLFIVIPMCILFIIYIFWANIVWSPNLAICEIEYNLFFMGIASAFYSYYLILVGYTSNNKYAILASTRVIIFNLTLEILMIFFILGVAFICESMSFSMAVSMQEKFFYNVLVFLPVMPILTIAFLVETGRIPFDLAEAESELIAGYTTEYGGFFFALFYLGEYFHLYTFSCVYILCLFGGWM